MVIPLIFPKVPQSPLGILRVPQVVTNFGAIFRPPSCHHLLASYPRHRQDDIENSHGNQHIARLKLPTTISHPKKKGVKTMWRVLNLQNFRCVFFRHFVSENMWENSADLMLNLLPQKTPRNTVVGNARKFWGIFTSTHQKIQKRTTQRVMFGSISTVEIPVATNAKMKGSPNCSANIWGIGWPASLIHSPDQQVCWGREKPTLKQTVSTPRD